MAFFFFGAFESFSTNLDACQDLYFHCTAVNKAVPFDELRVNDEVTYEAIWEFWVSGLGVRLRSGRTSWKPLPLRIAPLGHMKLHVSQMPGIKIALDGERCEMQYCIRRGCVAVEHHFPRRYAQHPHMQRVSDGIRAR